MCRVTNIMNSMARIKIISLNIEHDKHIPQVVDFVRRENPDVFLAQEVFKEDLLVLTKSIGLECVAHVPLARINSNGKIKISGIANFTNKPVVKSVREYYSGHPDFLPLVVSPAGASKQPRAILASIISEGEVDFCLVNTHFTLTPGGKTNMQQRGDLKKMLEILKKFPEHVLCGDFNAPRGKETFDKLAKIYKDNIPINTTTTIDKNFHRAGDLQIVIDGLFTTRGYEAENVRLVRGVSDHLAIVANITRDH